jgi:NTP pyrophosphatase (non-canonical NTP hydrolase)
MTKAQGFGSSISEEDQLLTEEELRQKNEVDTYKYLEFVDFVTSDASKNFDSFSGRLTELNEQGANIERLLTAAVGINAEGGEFMEIVKKMIFQGKPWNEDNREHLIIELGDVLWYIAQACIALNISMDEVFHHNVAKLLKRYPEGIFDVYKSENRSSDDR